MMQIAVRERTPSDDQQIGTTITQAFRGPNEEILVRALRDQGDIVAEYIALSKDLVIGHVAYSKLSAQSDTRNISAVALAPLAVSPEYQSQGVGSQLVEHSLQELKTIGVDLAIVLGHPKYYPRFGFSALQAKQISAPYKGASFMALTLTPGILSTTRWTVTYPLAFTG